MLLNRTETNTIGLVPQSALKIFRLVRPGKQGEPRGHCEACRDAIWSAGAYRIPRLAGLYCGLFCIEARLFGLNHCRWCAAVMDNPYLSITSRLCSEECEANYYAHVAGDHTAELGTGKRFLAWLQHRQPATYRALVSGATPKGFCRNPNCKRGENGRPATLTHLRRGSLYCSDGCRVEHFKKAISRSPKPPFSPSKQPSKMRVFALPSGVPKGRRLPPSIPGVRVASSNTRHGVALN